MRGAYVKHKNNSEDSAVVWQNRVDEHYLPVHKHQFLAGNNFKLHPKTGEESEVIVNEQVLLRFNIGAKDPIKEETVFKRAFSTSSSFE